MRKTLIAGCNRFLVLWLVLSAVHMRADDLATLNSRLKAAEMATSLDGSGTTPWYLKIAVQLYDKNGKPGEQGTVEEWWAGPGREKRVYTMPTYTASEVRQAGKVYRKTGSPYPSALLELLLQQVVHPVSAASDITDPEPQQRKISVGKVPLECIMLVQKLTGLPDVPLGLFPTYCFDAGKDSLRLTRDFGTQLIVRDRIGKYQERSIPIDVVVRSGELIAASGHTSILTGWLVNDADLSTEGLIEAGRKVSVLDPATAMPNLVHMVGTVPPPFTNSGVVRLHVLIGTDGYVHTITVLSSDSPQLTVAAIVAVRQWIYKPYVIDGAPRDVDTTLKFSFNYENFSIKTSRPDGGDVEH